MPVTQAGGSSHVLYVVHMQVRNVTCRPTLHEEHWLGLIMTSHALRENLRATHLASKMDRRSPHIATTLGSENIQKPH